MWNVVIVAAADPLVPPAQRFGHRARPGAPTLSKNASPTVAENTDAENIPSFTLLIEPGAMARRAINSAVVKPIPARLLPPNNNR